MSEFAEKFPRTFRRWKKRSGYLICLAVKNLEELDKLCLQLDSQKIKYCKFFEPDIGQVTAIAICPSEQADRATKRLRLAGEKIGKLDKNTVQAMKAA